VRASRSQPRSPLHSNEVIHDPSFLSCNRIDLCFCPPCRSSLPSPSFIRSPPISASRRTPACLVRLVHAWASGQRSRPGIQSGAIVGPLWLERRRTLSRRDCCLATSRRKNCRPGKRSMDHSKRQRRACGANPTAVDCQRDRVSTRLDPRCVAPERWSGDLSAVAV
jgi:hypothetical protein